MLHRLALVAALLCSPTTVVAQLTDIQPGRNFPTSTVAFGADHSEDVDIGDVDNDGDFDVVVANGGNSLAPQPNRIFINDGGLQGGTEGTFVEATATRFAGVTIDGSRDVEFADIDGDFDLDVFVANSGNTVNGGEVSRSYVNQGGAQFGTMGFFAEGTDAFWGTLVSIPLTDEVGVQDGFGPWKGFSCDCDFADFDDDGDMDVFYSSYGPALAGGTDSHLFLNDGTGRFDELWPWADAAADIQLHSLDVALADLDDDFDIDVIASSRETLPRIYRNNLSAGAWTGDPFTDVSATALPDLGGGVAFGYEAEYADIDGDGDFDVWMNNFVRNAEVVIRNDGGLVFELVNWIRGDPASLDGEEDFLDFDGDGDLDVAMSNVLGENWLFQAGQAQGLTETEGYFHRTGTTTVGSLAPWDETPATGNDDYTLDVEAGDMDGDGDPDLLMVNSFATNNRYWENVLGVPDTHAPTFHQVTVQGNKSDGTDTVIHAQVRDNAAFYNIGYYDTNLIYSVDGGREVCLRMDHQGGQQFRAVIPGGIDGQISYRVETTDDAGNTGVSTTTVYDQTASGVVLWEHLDCGTPGVYGRPYFDASGALTGNSTLTFNLWDAAPSALCTLWLSAFSTPAPFKGGFLYPFPNAASVNLVTDAGGQLWFPLVWPPGLPAGVTLWWQYTIADDDALGNVSVSNAMVSTTP